MNPLSTTDQESLKQFQTYIHNKKRLTPKGVERFCALIWNYYQSNRRPFPWREHITPYAILVSEIMLQQTQTYRVEPKYLSFIKTFPSMESLAAANLSDVLRQWQGLGYNRRGKYLHECAKKVINEYNGILPNQPTILETFPGIGPATARSITTFAYNKPTLFIETNIRSVYIHCFFENKTGIDDKELLPLIEQTLNHTHPREWYYALMDYGVALKKTFKNPNKKSKHYTKQSPFKGSNREIRSNILKELLKKPLTYKQLTVIIPNEEKRIQSNLNALCKEKLIAKQNNTYSVL